MIIHFTKMHGLGNDFVVIDAINQDISLTKESIKFLADRHFGIGCDQLLLLENPISSNADFKYRIFNADGNEVTQCGNGARCFAQFIRDNSRFFRNRDIFNKEEYVVDTHSGQLILSFKLGLISVNMGIPKHKPSTIPIATKKEKLTYHLTVNGEKIAFGAVSIGNPHAVIQVDNIDDYPVEQIGRSLESHPFFPERANIGFMQIIDPLSTIKLRVYERGVGETLACGSGACAAVIVGIEQGLLDQKSIIFDVKLRYGRLWISWKGRGHPVFMQGSATSVFEGQIELND